MTKKIKDYYIEYIWNACKSIRNKKTGRRIYRDNSQMGKVKWSLSIGTDR